jgi:hypothetical protein
MINDMMLMRIYNTFSMLIVCIVIFGCTALPDTPEAKAPLVTGTPAAQPPSFAVTADKGGIQATVSSQGETAILEVHSQSGIGSATVELVSGAPPETIVLRLYLKGLEQFRLLDDGTVVSASVASSDIGDITESVSSTQSGETPITPGSPLWLGIRIVSSEDKPHIPLDQGHFEITLPADFLHDGRRSFSIQWIDFYR